jgi:hypothetical protein
MGLERTNLMKSRVLSSDYEGNGPISFLLCYPEKSAVFLGLTDGTIKLWTSVREELLSVDLIGHEGNIVKLMWGLFNVQVSHIP